MFTEVQKTTSTVQGQRLALVIGVNEAPQTAAYLAPLQFAESSATAMAQVLKTCCNFELFIPPLLGEQASTGAVQNAIRKLALQRTPQDFLLLYFAGHGYLMSDDVEQSNTYLVTRDFDPMVIEDLGDEDAHLSLNWLSKILYMATNAGSVLVILDCCYGGNMNKIHIDRPLDTILDSLKQYFASSSNKMKGKSRATLAAAGQDAEAWEQGGSSIMTNTLLKALRGEYPESIDNNGNITLERLQDTLRKKMPPHQKFSFSGEIIGNSLIFATHSNLFEQTQREQRLRSMFTYPSRFMQDRLDSFVGREQELAHLHQRIDSLLPTGGYLTITGQPGQGKSSIIAKLIEDYSKEPDGLKCVAYHFIPPIPGPDHQVALLRNLMARLILKYDLSDLPLVGESRAVLREAFPRVLKEVADKGESEIVFIDGLDQLEAEQTGNRDLSFLPQGPGNPPNGIVFVMGTRPNDTLRPLELLKPYYSYPLPNLSRADFDVLLQHRGVKLEHRLINQFYETLGENVLYLDLVAKELAARVSITAKEVAEIIRQIVDNPENMFSLATDRLSQQQVLWREVIKPLLGLLLVTNEPLSRQQLKQIINLNTKFEVDGEQINKGLEGLGGFIITDGQQRYTLFHLKFRDYLRQDLKRPDKKYLFDSEDEQRWNRYFIAWCEYENLEHIWNDTASDVIEWERRRYARQHYITHLYRAKAWDKLFHVLDEGSYGRSKVQYDPSTRSYALDLDLGRDAATLVRRSLDESIQQLPHLWQYTLLRCSLASRADKYSIEAFHLMLLLGQETKAIGLAELITLPAHKAKVFTFIASSFSVSPRSERKAEQLFLQAEQISRSIDDARDQAEVLVVLGSALAQAGQHQEAERLWQEAEQISRSIDDARDQAEVLVVLGSALAQAGKQQEAERLWQEAEQVSRSIDDVLSLAELLAVLGSALAQAGKQQEAERVSRSIEDARTRAQVLVAVGSALAQAGQRQEAEQLWQEAERVSSFIDDAWIQAQTLVTVGSALAQAGQWQEAERVGRSIYDASTRTRVLIEVGSALAQAGQRQEAEQLWQETEQMSRFIEDVWRRAQVLVVLGSALAQAGQRQEAERLWQETEQMSRFIDDIWSRTETLIMLGSALAQVGRGQEAEQLSRSIEDVRGRAQVLIAAGSALAQAGQRQEAERLWQEAEQLSRSIDDPEKRVQVLIAAGSALAQAGQRQEAERLWQEAEQLSRSIDDPEKRAQVPVADGSALAQVGRGQEAEQLSRSIDDPEKRVQVLIAAGSALAQAGQRQEAERLWQEAEQLSRSINDPGSQTQTLSNLVTSLAQHNEYEWLLRIVNSLWRKADTRDYAIALLPLAFSLIPLQPSIGTAFSDAFAWVDDFLSG